MKIHPNAITHERQAAITGKIRYIAFHVPSSQFAQDMLGLLNRGYLLSEKQAETIIKMYARTANGGVTRSQEQARSSSKRKVGRRGRSRKLSPLPTAIDASTATFSAQSPTS
jgi:hypothetical protein